MITNKTEIEKALEAHGSLYAVWSDRQTAPEAVYPGGKVPYMKQFLSALKALKVDADVHALGVSEGKVSATLANGWSLTEWEPSAQELSALDLSQTVYLGFELPKPQDGELLEILYG